MIYFLLISVLFLGVASYFIFNKDILSPTILLIAGYMIAILSAIINIDEWGINLHLNTVSIILFGIFSFMIGEIIIRKIKINIRGNNEQKIKPYKIKNYKILIILVFQILTLILLYKEVLRIASISGDINGNIMTAFRQQITYSTDSVSRINSLVQQMMKINSSAGIIFLFIFVRNYIITRGIWNNIKYLFPVFLYLTQGFMQGGRGHLIKISVIVLVVGYITTNHLNKSKFKLSFKLFRNIIICVIAFFGIFYFSKELVGRQVEVNFLEYITRYSGGSIQLLDQYMQGPKISYDGIIGAETFPGLYGSMNKLGFTNISLIKSLEFRYTTTGIFLGNIYTGLRRFFNDFGWMGVFICQLIMSFVFNFMYKIVKISKCSKRRYNFMLLLYSYMLYCVPQQAMEDSFFISIISVGFIVEVIILMFMFWFITEFNVKIKL